MCTLISIIWIFCSFTRLSLYVAWLLLLLVVIRKYIKKKIKVCLHLSSGSFFLLLNLFHYNSDRILISIRNLVSNISLEITLIVSRLRWPCKSSMKVLPKRYDSPVKIIRKPCKKWYESPVKMWYESPVKIMRKPCQNSIRKPCIFLIRKPCQNWYESPVKNHQKAGSS